MQENWQQIVAVVDQHDCYVLATIVATRGSTYQKMGAMMLVTAQGRCIGLLSGGCLEADISLHAKEVLKNGQNMLLNYDLQDNEDTLWGLGLGCDGAIDILLQPLLPKNNHLGFFDLINAIKQRKTGYFVQQISTTLSPKAEFIISHIEKNNFQLSSLPFFKAPSLNKVPAYLITPVLPPISLLVCGAGPDVVPIVLMAQQMGWQISLWDHRKKYLSQIEFAHCQQRCVRPKQITPANYEAFDAVLVMTHNITLDSEYLAQLLTTQLTYIGLLGPLARRNKLLSTCQFKSEQIKAQQVNNRVFGPIGLDLGGRSPQSIALSIMAEIQQHFCQQYANDEYKSWQI